jgi:SAM-dependent methyltransferase
MQQRAFEVIQSAEDSWWYHARIFGIQRVLSSFGANGERICDVGAGYGAMCRALKPFGHVTAFEPDDDARKHCRAVCDAVEGTSDLGELGKSGVKYSLVTLLDVVEHVRDDDGFLKEIGALLAPSGHVLVTVPAFSWLWSELDELAMHYRRYNKEQITRVVEEAGFEILYASYWNMMLIIPAILVRKGTGKAGYSAFSMPRWIDRLFFEWVRLETRLMPRLSLPFGTSVFVYARKKAAAR